MASGSDPWPWANVLEDRLGLTTLKMASIRRSNACARIENYLESLTRGPIWVWNSSAVLTHRTKIGQSRRSRAEAYFFAGGEGHGASLVGPMDGRRSDARDRSVDRQDFAICIFD